MTFVSDDGKKKELAYPREKIVELRKNRYEKGLWLRVEGVTMESHLIDLDADLIEALSEEFWKINTEFNERLALEASFEELPDN